nr:HNH endonuclease signature motif containing protein [Cellulomonas hominis]
MLRLLSRLHPAALPYQANWRAGVAHPVYAALSATLDHVVPVALGGHSLDEANLVCACWSCNLRKADLRMADAGFELTLEPSHRDWDGLSSSYRPLWDAAGRPDLGSHEREWMRAVDAAAAPGAIAASTVAYEFDGLGAPRAEGQELGA